MQLYAPKLLNTARILILIDNSSTCSRLLRDCQSSMGKTYDILTVW